MLLRSSFDGVKIFIRDCFFALTQLLQLY